MEDAAPTLARLTWEHEYAETLSAYYAARKTNVSAKIALLSSELGAIELERAAWVRVSLSCATNHCVSCL